ncbi:MAG TPA: FAD-binding oxidoreductase [Steroidobacteraceae bacterium]|nr:FAD-binding oxidoreductase [Steroidobacteraceae bacterium]
MLDGSLLAELRAAVGEQALLTGERVRECAVDVQGHVPGAPVLVRPRSTAEVAAVLRACHARGQPVVPQGGRTNLVEGTVSSPEEIILSLERMNRIERVDVPGRTMRVEAGVILQRAQEEAERHELMFPLDLGARGSCTIGGNISTNAGGVRVVRFGMMRSLVLGIEAVLADGTVLNSLNRMLKNNAGYDLKQLFIGSEGTLGIVTRADLRLVSRPRSTATAFVACADFAALVRLLGHLDARLGGQLAAFEALWPEYYRITTAARTGHTAVLSRDYGMYGLIETLGSDPEADPARLAEALETALESGLVLDAVVAKSESERRAIWEPREDVWEVQEQHGVTFNFDVSLAIEEMEPYLARVRRDVLEHFPRGGTFAFGHIADGNLHIIVVPGPAPAQDAEQVRATAERIVYEPLRAIGGSISAEHGIGLERRMHLGISRTEAEIATMRALKAALDPKRILNRGKVIE